MDAFHFGESRNETVEGKELKIRVRCRAACAWAGGEHIPFSSPDVPTTGNEREMICGSFLLFLFRIYYSLKDAWRVKSIIWSLESTSFHPLLWYFRYPYRLLVKQYRYSRTELGCASCYASPLYSPFLSSSDVSGGDLFGSSGIDEINMYMRLDHLSGTTPVLIDSSGMAFSTSSSSCCHRVILLPLDLGTKALQPTELTRSLEREKNQVYILNYGVGFGYNTMIRSPEY